MPTTRHSPSRAQTQVPVQAQAPAAAPMGDVLRELALLRQSMESKFVESASRVDGLKEEVLSKLDDNDRAMSEIQLAVTDVTLSVDENRRAIHEVRAEVERREVELPHRVKAIVQEALAKTTTVRSVPSSSTGAGGVRPRPLGSRLNQGSVELQDDKPKDKNKSNAYNNARRSLRFWPVSRQGDLKERTVEFMVNELQLDQQHATSLAFDVRRVGATRSREQAGANQVKDEVLVRFDSLRERDEVRSFAKNLERKGRGLRLEIPDHLWPSFRVLQDLAFELKSKHPTFRRNVLFDDAELDLKMDFTISDGTWKSIRPEEARNSLKRCRPGRSQREVVGSAELDGLLENDNSDQGEQMDVNHQE